MHSSSATRSAQSDSLPSDALNGSAPLLVGIDDVARLLNVSARTVWSLTESGSLPHLRIGRRVLYPVDGLRRWAAERTRGGASSE
jgi:excisionase family DNA binding protein